MKMRGRRLAARTVCTCCNGLILHTRATEKREAQREVRDEADDVAERMAAARAATLRGRTDRPAIEETA